MIQNQIILALVIWEMRIKSDLTAVFWETISTTLAYRWRNDSWAQSDSANTTESMGPAQGYSEASGSGRHEHVSKGRNQMTTEPGRGNVGERRRYGPSTGTEPRSSPKQLLTKPNLEHNVRELVWRKKP